MVFVDSEVDIDQLQLAKILIAGGFGVGKTTFVSSISEIMPLHTEEQLTEFSAQVDDLEGIEGKTTTTVALDFGRITINRSVVLYLFGTPGQDRFWFMWRELSAGALGAVVLVDTRRVSESFSSIDFFESRGIPFVLGVNCFNGEQSYDPQEIYDALDLESGVPILLCDARDRESCKNVLVGLLEHLLALAGSST